jgi:uncharacterized protein (DUF427 family)
LTASETTESATAPSATDRAVAESTATESTASASHGRADRPDPRTEIRLDHTAKRIRVFFAGDVLADSVSAQLCYVTGQHPEYVIPVAEITWAKLMVDDVSLVDSPVGSYRPIRSAVGKREIGRSYVGGPASGFVSFDFEGMDAWFEEDEQIWFHARDPFRRVDVIESSRQIEITVGSQVVARSSRPRLVTETGLPERWYVPRIDVDWSHLTPSATSSGCQYKGIANWWHMSQEGSDKLADLVWGYERPIPEAGKLAGLVSFYAEHAAVETYVDGILQAKPVIDGSAISPSLNLANLAGLDPIGM